jgi:hypothetical protein
LEIRDFARMILKVLAFIFLGSLCVLLLLQAITGERRRVSKKFCKTLIALLSKE